MCDHKALNPTMATTISTGSRLGFGDMDWIIPGELIPESGLRTSVQQHQSHFQYPGQSQYGYADSACPQSHSTHHFSQNHTPSSRTDHLHPDYHGTFAEMWYHENPASTMDATFSSLVEDQDLAATLASFQPCDDCTPATKTTIPHHHHPSGRLAGASATLGGHFCCSWLVHGQLCFLCFESAEALDNHIKEDHAGSDGTYRCLWQDCSKHDSSTNTDGPINFGNKPKLMRHVHSHTGYKPFPCPYPGCDKGFVTKEQLKNHETTHTKSRKYKCDQCGKAFAVKSALTTHITAVHEEKKIHRCEICGKSFADSSNLSKHKQTHFRSSGVSKHRNKRGASIATSNRSTPSISTPCVDHPTPHVHISNLREYPVPEMAPGMMAPPAVPKIAAPPLFCTLPSANCSLLPSISSTSYPLSQDFDPNCYCCDHRCSPPAGPATPCTEADDCDLDGFCDLPDCTATPCDEAEGCNRDGFCDLPECLTQDGCNSVRSSPETSMPTYRCDPTLGCHQAEQLRNFHLPPHWDDMLEQDSQRPFSQMELEEQFTNMHGE